MNRSLVLAAVIVLSALGAVSTVAVLVITGNEQSALTIFASIGATVTSLLTLLKVDTVKQVTQDTNSKTDDIHSAVAEDSGPKL